MVISMSVISKNVRKNQGTGIKFFEASQSLKYDLINKCLSRILVIFCHIVNFIFVK